MNKKLNISKILRSSKKTIASTLLLLASQLNAIETTHLVKPHSSFESIALANSCSTMIGQSFSTRCNMALFPFQKNEGISLSVMGKSDGDSIDNGRDLIFDPITEDLLRKLFEETNYNSFTFNSEVSFKNSLFEITYIPYYLMADLYLFNPVFPEISLNLVNREELRVSSGYLLFGDGDLKNSYNLSMGTSLYYYSHTYESTVFSLFEDYMSMGLGKSYKTLYGQFSYNLELVTNDYLSDFDTQNLNLGLNYTLRLVSLFMGLSEKYKTFGISFNSDQFNVGISYSKEKDALSIQDEDDDAAYIGMAVNL